MADPDEARVIFSVKDLFLDVKADLRRIEGKVEHMAKQADLLIVAERVNVLETSKASTEAVDRYKKWQYGILAAVAADVAIQLAKNLRLLPS